MPLKDKLPSSVVVTQNEKGWMNQDVMKLWLSRCSGRRPDGFFRQKPALLVMDSMRAHITPEIKESVHALNSIPAIIPGGLTKLLQPLDISVNRSFKLVLRELWKEWMTTGEHSFTNTGKMRRATFADVCGWVATAWRLVPVSCIKAGFKKAEVFAFDPDFHNSSDDDSDMDGDKQSGLPAEIAELFNSESEGEEFDGFVPECADDLLETRQ